MTDTVKFDMHLDSPLVSKKEKQLKNGATLSRLEFENGVIIIDEMLPDSRHIISSNFKMVVPRGESKLVPLLTMPMKDFVDYYEAMK